MTAKKAVYTILDRMKPEWEFSGHWLKVRAQLMTGKQLYPATAIRHLRSYRRDTGRDIKNINNLKSLYRVVS